MGPDCEQAVKVNRVRRLRLVTGDPRDLPGSLLTSIAFEADDPCRDRAAQDAADIARLGAARLAR